MNPEKLIAENLKLQRELEIEAALEKVRSKSLAMHKSDELGGVVAVVFKKLMDLNFDLKKGAAIIITFIEGSKDHEQWIVNHDHEYKESLNVPYFSKPIGKEFSPSKGGKTKFLTKFYTKSEKDDYFSFLFENSDYRNLTNEIKERLLDVENYSLSIATEKNSGIAIPDMKGNLLSAEQEIILKRFAKVFEQAYTRFLELQKAEAQTREAKIEAALERVRARSLAMHNSDELGEVAIILYKELNALGLVNFLNCGFEEIDETQQIKHAWICNPEGGSMEGISYPIAGDSVLRDRYEAWKKQKPIIAQKIGGKKLEKHLQFMKPYLNEDVLNSAVAKFPDPTVFYFANFKNGCLHLISDDFLEENEELLLIRFAHVFEQSFTRFLDLQKAEAQAREARIETALERVRARSLAMHQSSELGEVNVVLFEQLKLISNIDLRRFVIQLFDEEKGLATFWYTSIDGKDTFKRIIMPYRANKAANEMVRAWKENKTLSLKLVGNDLQEFVKYIVAHGFVYPKGESVPKAMFLNVYPFLHGQLLPITYEVLSKEEFELIGRFAKVFEQAYIRFLDLEKAEAQAKEAKIEAALERVRSRSMGMQSTDELMDVVDHIFKGLEQLGYNPAICTLFTIDKKNSISQNWASFPSKEDSNVIKFTTPFGNHPMVKKTLEYHEKSESHLFYHLKGKEKNEYDDFIFQYLNLPEVESSLRAIDDIHCNIVFMSHGGINVALPHTMEESDLVLIQRFLKVVDLSYTRFYDLQMAEKQAEEAQIEASLERIRSRTMAMQSSKDLKEVVAIVFEELGLSMEDSICILLIFNWDKKEIEWWSTGMTEKLVLPRSYKIPIRKELEKTTLFKRYKKLIKDKTAYNVFEFSGDTKKEWEKYVFEQSDLRNLPIETQQLMRSFDSVILSDATISCGTLEIAGPAALSKEKEDVLKRYAKVIDLTYRRYEDLKLAESQMRDAQIEAALERVRSASMAMHHSDELSETIVILFNQLNSLGVEAESSWVSLINEKESYTEVWTTHKGVMSKPALMTPENSPTFKEEFKSWKNKVPSIKAQVDHKIIIKTLKEVFDIELKVKKEQKTFHLLQIRHRLGYIGLGTWEEASEEDFSILQRFTKVFEQTYTRFLDLQKAEAQAKEAIKQTSLDRVRAEIASMRTTEDLDRIIPLVWRELTNLDVPFFRCGVFIMDEAKKSIHAYLSNPKGESLAAMDMDFEISEFVSKAAKYWKKQEVYKEEWSQQQFIDFTNSIIDQGLIDDPQKYQGAKEAPEKLVLHMIPFKQGMLYVGSSDDLTEEQTELGHDLAKAFAIAYARYEDFTELEMAKSKVDTALTDLKDTQNQLVQSEKMASLGELTAGIAHEIQNPLNFVNNFSEVSKEMMEELREERNKKKEDRDEDLLEEILNDIEDNLEKINHHGDRASSIVKGMLEHSKTSSGDKVPTDINALADEYLRLAYHGLRAKDKSFNADFKMNFDKSLPKVKIIPTDFGRLLLNLINNAFWAASTKTLEKGGNHKPLVSISTKLLANNQMLITIQDNGHGIPKHIVDKIFQPFFTTKPTGEGTGLGLSLAYDIVTKGHGGEITVKTKEGEGTTMHVTIPVKN